MAAVDRTAQPGRWQRRILRAVLPAGVLLLFAWLVWVGLPFVMGAQRSDLSVPQAVIGLATSLILIVTGYGYRRATPAAAMREPGAYEAARPHPFVPVDDAGTAALGAAAGRNSWGGDAAQVAMTNRYQRMDGCAVPGCGRPRDAEIHAPAE